MARTIPAVNLTDKCIISSSRYLYPIYPIVKIRYYFHKYNFLF